MGGRKASGRTPQHRRRYSQPEDTAQGQHPQTNRTERSRSEIQSETGGTRVRRQSAITRAEIRR